MVGTEVADALLDEGVGGDELEALELAEVGILAHHVDEEQLGDVAQSEIFLAFLRNGLFHTEKDSRIAAISFCVSARSSACVLQLRILVMKSLSRIMRLNNAAYVEYNSDSHTIDS